MTGTPDAVDAALPPAAGLHRVELAAANEMGTVNAWIVDDDPLTLVDAGTNVDGSIEVLEAALATIGRRVEDVGLVVLTHHHTDHLGLVGTVVRRSGAEVAALAPVAPYLQDFPAEAARDRAYFATTLRRHGADEERIAATLGAWERFHRVADAATVTVPLEPGSRIELRDRTFEVLHRPGHSETDVLLVDADRRLMLGGDHLLRAGPSVPVRDRPLPAGDGAPWGATRAGAAHGVPGSTVDGRAPGAATPGGAGHGADPGTATRGGAGDRADPGTTTPGGAGDSADPGTATPGGAGDSADPGTTTPGRAGDRAATNGEADRPSSVAGGPAEGASGTTRGSTIDHDLGSLVRYRASLRATAVLDVDLVLPGHRRPFTDPGAVVAAHLARQEREASGLLRRLTAEPTTAIALVTAIWPEAPPAFSHVLLSGVLGTLGLLRAEGRVVVADDGATGGPVRFAAA